MNAIQFIQQHGVEKAREFGFDKKRPLMTHVTKNGRNWVNANHPSCRATNSELKEMIFLPFLRRLVESVDLVKRYGGIAEAKTIHQDEFWCERAFERLEQAIADYEAIYSEQVK